MIRDPSDGSVRENTGGRQPEARTVKPPEVDKRRAAELGSENRSSDPRPPASGLPFSSQKPENIARLERSREWLRDYREGKFNVRGSHDKERSPAGDQGTSTEGEAVQSGGRCS